MAQEILPSAHLLEMFNPYMNDEARMIEVLRRTVALGFYRAVELPVFFDAANRSAVRAIIEGERLLGTTFAGPYLAVRGLSLSDQDEGARRRAVALVTQLADYAAESGMRNLCVASGPDPAPELRGLAKVALADSMIALADHARDLGLNLTIEPLDRNAHKRQLIGPMEETVTWFAPIHDRCPNAYIHWDSAHEALGGIDLVRSLDFASPYLAQLHLCDAILDPAHPCFGDLHMDCALAPGWETEGFLTPEVGARILSRVASFDTPAGVSAVCASVEIHGHPGDHLWLIEEHARSFLRRCFDLAGVGA